MKIGLAAYLFKNKDITYNLSKMKLAIQNIDCDLLCFGESFLQGFDSLTWEYEKDKNVALRRDSKEILDLLDYAKQYHKDIAFGYFEKDNDKIYSSYAVSIHGELMNNYRRISIGWKEFLKTDNHYAEGSGSVSFSYKGHQIKIALCGDLWEEELRNHFICDDILLWPIYVNYSIKEWGTNIKDYAIQANQYCKRVLMINSLSNHPKSVGGAFFFENGKAVQSIPFEKEEVLIVDIE